MRPSIVVGILLAGGTPLAAQQHHQEMDKGQGKPAMCAEGCCAGMDMQGGGMMGAVMNFAPDQLLKQSTKLGLTADQTARLTALRDATAKAADAAHEPAMAANQSMMKAMQETPADTAAIHGYFAAHHRAMENMMWIRMNAAMQAKEMLTEKQRGLVKE